MRTRLHKSLVAAMMVAACLEAQAQGPPPAPVKPDDVVGHVERTTQWYQQISSVEQIADVGDLVSRDRLHDSALGALQLVFDYARAQAALLRAGSGNQTAPAAEGETTSNIDQLD